MSERVSLNTPERPSWTLRQAVLVYLQQERLGGGSEQRAYATLHNVSQGKRGPQLEAGVPATREACADLARALGATSTLAGFVPPNLLYMGAQSIIWWRPPAPARIFFDTTKNAAGDQSNDKTGAALIGKRTGVIRHPGLVFAVAGGEWYVYAVMGAERPEPTTALLRAPYFNVWVDGRICTGNVRLPDTLSTQALGAYEKAFFESEFTHPNVHGRERLLNGNPYAFWKELLDRSAKKAADSFPTNSLVNLKLSLQTLAKRLERSGKPLDGDD